MIRRYLSLVVSATCLILLWNVPIAARPPDETRKAFEKVGFTQNLGARVPLDLPFRNEKGDAVPLSTYFGQKPVLLTLVYFRCPMLCTEVLNGTVQMLRALPLSVGKDFNVVTVSFDSREKPPMAAAKKNVYLDRYNRPGSRDGWAFLTGRESSIKALADAVGFHYAYDKELDQFEHGSGIMILTPQGQVAHYFYGVHYPPQDVRLALIQASKTNVGTPSVK